MIGQFLTKVKSTQAGTESGGRVASGPIAYLITITCYGQKLHGRARASVDRHHNLPGSRYVNRDPRRELAEAKNRR